MSDNGKVLYKQAPLVEQTESEVEDEVDDKESSI
jgi:hypothetical protein